MTIVLSIVPIPATNAQPGGDSESTIVPRTTTEAEADPKEFGEGGPEAPEPTLDAGPTTTVPAEAADAEDDFPDDLAIAQLDVGDATIRINKAGIRQGEATSAGASGLAGATFAAYHKRGSASQSIPNRPPDATCMTDASGSCDLPVDPDLGPHYLVVEQSAPTGWGRIDQIALGRFNASGTPRDYRWNVRVSNGQTTEVPETEIRNSSTQNWRDRPNRPSGSGPYRWADVKDNVPYPEGQCGLSIAMLFDLSGSIGNNLPLVKTAATEFVEDLTGTPTSIAVFTFSTNSPQNNGGSQNRPTPVSIADPEGAAQVKGFINGFSAAGGGTNWDEGLRRIAGAGHDYDLAIVLTDGNPTAWRGEKSSTSDVDDYDVEEAVHSANWIKELGTRIVAVGFSGQQGGLTALNLKHISGPVQDDDYYLTTFGDLAGVLAEIALRACGGTINVEKKVAPTWDGIADVPPEPNWGFERAADQDYVAPPSGTTGPNGEPLTFRVTFDQNHLERDATITENPGSTQLIPTPGGANARCLINGEEEPNRIRNEVNGFTITDIEFTEIISCQVVNGPAGLQALKYNDLNGNGQRDAGEPPLQGWTIFLDANSNSALDPGERSALTDANGLATFDRLDAPADYRVCEVLQPRWFNTEPGGAAACKGPISVAVGQTAGPVAFGNQQAGGFTVTKAVVDESGLVPTDTEFTVNVGCLTPDGGPIVGFPRDFVLTDGHTVKVGPLPFGAECSITETGSAGAGSVSVVPDEVTIGGGDAVEVVVTNTYPAGRGAVVKVTAGALAELAPEGTPFAVEVACTFPDGFPVQGQVPGFDPLELTIRAGSPGQPGTPVGFGPLPVGSRCSIVETDDGGASEVAIEPNPVTITGSAEPVSVTVTNTFNAAALRILKEVRGTPLPPDTVFTAQVVCTFGGVERFNDAVEFSVNDPGLVTDLPVGSSCTVTETDSHGAQAVTISPEQPVILAGPSPVSVDVTITNTFEAPGELVVEKVVEGVQSPVLPDGTVYTVQVACSFSGVSVGGYPRDLRFTTPDQLSETLVDLPVGTECTVTETDSQGAQVEISPPQPVTIKGRDGDPVTVTVRNTYEVDEFSVTKVVDDSAGRVPVNTEYTVAVRCSYPGGFPGAGPIPGFDPLELQLTAGQTVSTGDLPVGATCTITETDSAGAASFDVVPDRVVVGEGDDPVTVTVTNTYPAGALVLRKAVDDVGTGLVPRGTEYTLEVSCVYPDGYPVKGPIAGFDPLEVVVGSGVQGRPGTPVTVSPLPVGTQCTVTEPDPQGAATVGIFPEQPVTIIDDLENPVEVTVTNTYPVGSGHVVKVTDGPLASRLAPQGTQFTVEVGCTFPDDFPVQGAIPGYDPLELAIEAGEPGQPGTPTPFGSVPLGSECTVVETEDRGASEVVISPVQPLLITSSDTPVEVTVTNTFLAAALRISKVTDGPGAGTLPPETEFTARAVCTFEGEVFSDTEVRFTVDRPGVVSSQPKFSSCTVTETDSQGAQDVTISPEQPVILDGEDPVVVDVTITNTFGAGELTITKVLSGDGAAFVPDGTAFLLQAGCEYNGSRLNGYPRNVTLTTPDQLTETLTGLPIGSECSVVELDEQGAQSVEITPAQPVTIVDAPTPVDVTVTNTFGLGDLTITKQLGGAPVPDGTSFTIEAACSFLGADLSLQTVTLTTPDQLTGTMTGLPVGTECTLNETANGGASSVQITPNPATVADAPTPVEVTVTNTFDAGELTITKVLSGDGAAFVPDGTAFTVEAACTFGGLSLPVETVTLTTPDQLTQTVQDLPVGAECSITETGSAGAGSVSVVPDEVTIGGGDAVEVVVTNTYPVGSFQIEKVVEDVLGFVPPDTAFTLEARCAYPADFPVQGQIPGFDPLVMTLTGGQTTTVGPLPARSTCTISETDSTGAESSIVPSEVLVGETETVTVTNSYPVGTFEIAKSVVDETGLVPPGTEFTVEATCAFPDGFPLIGGVPGFSPLMLTLTDGQSEAVGPLPAGSTCTIQETDAAGAVTSVVPDEVTVIDGSTPKVVVTNRYEAGTALVTKSVAGELASLAPPSFPIEVSCTYPAGFVEQGAIPGFDPLRMDLGNEQSAPVGPLPVGSTCGVVEVDDGGASEVTYTPDDEFTITGGEQDVGITVTNTFDSAGLRILKVLEGPGASFVPTDTVFVANVICMFEGLATEFETAFGVNDPGLRIALPVGAECTVTEVETNGATAVSIDPPQSVTLEGEGPVLVDVTVTNIYGVGRLSVTKVLAGAGPLSVPDGTAFTVEVACAFLGEALPIETVTLTTPDQLTQSVSGLPVGATCTITETEDGGALDVTIQPAQVTITDGPTPVPVTVTNTFGTGSILIRKAITGSGASSADEPFRFRVECSSVGSTPDPQPSTVTITPPSSSATVSGLPIGASCAVQEFAPYGGADGPPRVSPASVVVGSGEPVVVTVTNTFTKRPPLALTGSIDVGRALMLSAVLLAVGAALLLVARRIRSRAKPS